MDLNKFLLINKYQKNTNIKFTQAILKASLIPINDYIKYIPYNGVVLDAGCGEGLTSHLLKMTRPDIKIYGIDKNKKIINEAKKIQNKNIFFCNLDIFSNKFVNSSEFSSFDLVICNDFVHHLNYAHHRNLIEILLKKIKFGGHLILKEVNRHDVLDYKISKFFDKILYPKDDLSYRSNEEWLNLFNRIGYQKKEIRKLNCKHLWPASKTMYFIKKKRINFQSDQENKILQISKNVKKKGYQNILITGGSGFIGRNFLKLTTKYKRINFIVLTRRFFDFKNPNITVFKCELSELKKDSPIFDYVDIVLHMASEVKYENGENLKENNIIGTKVLLESIGNRNKKNIKKIIFTSSIGAIERSSQDQCLKPLTTKSRAYPSSYYGYSKYIGEKLIKKFTNKNIILRICWCYGKYMTDDTHLKFISDSIKKNKIFTYFNYPARINIIHVNDMARIISYFIKNKQINKTYYVHNGNPETLGNIIKQLKILHKKNLFLFNFPAFTKKIIIYFRKIVPFKFKTLFMNTMIADNRLLLANKNINIKNKFPLGLKDLIND
jgi:nucleoside-diphosphate-sugar epimerase/SAM-dependent methyltransferase